MPETGATGNPAPVRTRSNIVRVVTYNIHGCVGTDMKRDCGRIAGVLSSLNADVLCLQEVDVGRRRSSHSDQAAEIARALGLHYHFHAAIQDRREEYGDAILSREPVHVVLAGKLPEGPPAIYQEPRGALWVRTQVQGLDWNVITTHFGLGRVERLRQARAICGPQWLGDVPMPTRLVFCGDLNSRTGSRVHRELETSLRNAAKVLGKSQSPTFSTRWPLLTLDYVYVGPGIVVKDLEVIDSAQTRRASDHFPLCADLDAENPGQTTKPAPIREVPL